MKWNPATFPACIFLGHLLPPLPPLNVGLQNEINSLAIMIDNIGKGRGAKGHCRRLSGEVSQLFISGSGALL